MKKHPIKCSAVVAYEVSNGDGLVIKIQVVKKSGKANYPPVKLLITEKS